MKAMMLINNKIEKSGSIGSKIWLHFAHKTWHMWIIIIRYICVWKPIWSLFYPGLYWFRRGFWNCGSHSQT